VLFCDVCRREQYLGSVCRKCGVEMCAHCWETHGQTYPSNVHFSNGGDGYYCNLCDGKLLSQNDDPLHAAYVKVHELRLELERWNKDFDARVKAAEKDVRNLAAASDRIVSVVEPKNIHVVRKNGVVGGLSSR